MRTVALPPISILTADGKPWRPSAREQQLLLGGDSPYKGASSQRRAGALWHPSSGSADSDFLPSQPLLRARTRDASRNNPLAASAIKTCLSCVIGSGLIANPTINRRVLGLSKAQAQAKKQEIADLWFEAFESIECDLTRISDGYGLQRLAYRASLDSGDVLNLAPAVTRAGSRFKTKIQLIEADRIQNPNGELNSARLVAGVELAVDGSPAYYHVSSVHPGEGWQYGVSAQSQRIRAFGAQTGRRNAWLLYQRQRPQQTRGVPYLSICLEQLKQLDRYTDAELAAAVVGGSFTVFVTSPDPKGGLMPFASYPVGAPASVVPASSDITLDYGAVVDLMPGEKIETASPGRPNRAFGEFIQSIIELVGAGLEIPYEVLRKHFTASYSASRAALLEAWRFFRAEREWFAAHWCQPYYELFLTEAVLNGLIDLPGWLESPRARRAWGYATWTGPSMGQLNPHVEALAARERVDIGISSLTRETAEYSGADWEDIHEAQVEERARRIADGLEPDPDAPEPQAGPRVPVGRYGEEHDNDAWE